MLWLLVGLSGVGYVLRTNIAVAAKPMQTELGLTNIQLGWVFGAFLWAYTIFQLPGGRLGDALGSRAVLAWATGLGGEIGRASCRERV